jgi:transposase
LALFESPVAEAEESVSESVRVNLKAVRVRRTRDFGDVYLGVVLWRMLELDRLLESEIESGREEVSWGVMACVLAVARLVEPSSELHVEDTWYERTVLSDMLGVPVEKVERHRLYRTLDALLPQKERIEKHLLARVGELFKPDLDLVLYDVTSTYFEGQAQANPQAKRGYSRDHRPDCKQVCIALVVTREGFPLGYEIFPGNQSDVTTVQTIVEEMEKRYGSAARVWVMDRGMVSEENIEFLKKGGRRYIVGTPKPMLRSFERQLTEKDWQAIREGLEVKQCPGPDGQEVFILCRSAERQKKEQAMHERFEKRIEEGLMQIEAGCRKRKQTPVAVAQRVGKLLGRNTRAAGLFRVDIAGTARQGAKLNWSKKQEWRDWAKLSEGCYLLRSNITDWGSQDMWRSYIQLTEAEKAFQIEKSDLCIRPVWHRLEKRVKGHILFSFLAYALWKTLQAWMQRAGLGSGVRTVLEELARLKASDVLLGTTENREVTVCCVTRPDGAQRAILDRLGLELPERLGRARWVKSPAQPAEL